MSWQRLVVGIGNPGPEYDQTRHNAGFEAIDALAARFGLSFTRLSRKGPDGSKCFSGRVKAQVATGTAEDGTTFLLVKPRTYVNLSGDVVGPLMRHAELSPDALFVFVDDLNLPLGRIRIRPSGSPGGHNGLKSIQSALGSQDYPRLRLGIGPVDPAAVESLDSTPAGATPTKANTDADTKFADLQFADHLGQVDYVLAPFSRMEREVLGPTLNRSVDAVFAWLNGADLTSLMELHNQNRGLGPSND